MAIQERQVAHEELVGGIVTRMHIHPTILPFISGSIILTNMPSILTELPNDHYRIMMDLEGFNRIRATLNIEVAGHSSAMIEFQYYDQVSLIWTLFPYLIIPISTIGSVTTEWYSLPEAAKAQDVGIRMIGMGGNGKKDPKLNQIYLHLS